MSSVPVCDVPLAATTLGSLLTVSPLYVYLELFQPISPVRFASVRAAVLAAVVRYIILSTTSLTGALLVRAVVLLSQPKRLSSQGSGGGVGEQQRCVNKMMMGWDTI
jgi:hypothetical protein